MKLRCPYCKHEFDEPKATCPSCGRTMVIPGKLRKMSLRQRKQAKDRIYREFEREQQRMAAGLPEIRPGRGPAAIGVMLLVLVIVGGALVGRAKLKFAPSKMTRGKEEVADKDLRILDIAIERFRLDCGRYPTTQEGLRALIIDPGIWEWRRPYVNLIRPDPWGHHYFYESSATNAFELRSLGPDGLKDTPDDRLPVKPTPAEISVKLVTPPETNAATADDTPGTNTPANAPRG